MRFLLLLALTPLAAFAAGADVTPEASVLAALPHWAQIALMVLGAAGSIVGPSSLLADFLNNLIRAKRLNGEKPSSLLLSVSATINRAALNLGKGSRLAKAAKEATQKEPKE